MPSYQSAEAVTAWPSDSLAPLLQYIEMLMPALHFLITSISFKIFCCLPSGEILWFITAWTHQNTERAPHPNRVNSKIDGLKYEVTAAVRSWLRILPSPFYPRDNRCVTVFLENVCFTNSCKLKMLYLSDNALSFFLWLRSSEVINAIVWYFNSPLLLFNI